MPLKVPFLHGHVSLRCWCCASHKDTQPFLMYEVLRLWKEVIEQVASPDQSSATRDGSSDSVISRTSTNPVVHSHEMQRSREKFLESTDRTNLRQMTLCPLCSKAHRMIICNFRRRHCFKIFRIRYKLITSPTSHPVQGVSNEYSRKDFGAELMHWTLVFRRHKKELDFCSTLNNPPIKRRIDTDVQKASGHPPVGLAHFGDGSNTPLILPTSFLSVQTAPSLTKGPSFTRRTARSAIPFVSDLCGVDLMIPFQLIASFNKFESTVRRNGSWMFFWASCDVRAMVLLSLLCQVREVVCGKFRSLTMTSCSVATVLIKPTTQLRRKYITDCAPKIVFV